MDRQESDKFSVDVITNVPVEFARKIIDGVSNCTEANMGWLRDLSTQPVEIARALLQSVCKLNEVHGDDPTEASDRTDGAC